MKGPVAWWYDPWRPPRFLVAVTLGYLAWSLIPVLIAVVLVCLGISPKLGPISDWGLAMQRKQLLVDAATCATSEAGIYAVGDIVHYPGKKKLIVSGFHEATQAAFAAAAQLQPDQAEVLHYTTSSRLLQQRLGLLPPG